MKCPASGCDFEADVIDIAIHILTTKNPAHSVLGPAELTAALKKSGNVM
ncbi:MAG: hypothetical protein JRN62_04105 [Nitrososphaerota archaeon]|nr:hypothetical protein [Nitrososphaerota archaeon]MDG6948786.1 hypothetical protein [Nitrososphaerota archaeon]